MATFCLVSFIMVLLLLFRMRNHAEKSESIVYIRDQLIAVLLPGARPEISEELRRRHRGCRAGAKLKAKWRRYKPSVPVIIMENVRSLGNKIVELVALVKT